MSLGYSTYMGFSANEFANSITVDSAGYTYITGITGSFGGISNVFVAKMSPTGSNVYFTYFPGSQASGGIAVDRWGNTYVTSTSSAGQPVLTKLNPTGTSIVYRATLGWHDLKAVKVDSAGNAYLAGSVLRTAQDYDVAVGKVDPTGTRFIYAVSFGGTSLDWGEGIDIDGNGNAYVTGDTYSANFPVVNAYNQPTLRGTRDAFVTKVNATGTSLSFSTYLGGDGRDSGTGIAVGRAGGPIYVTGTTLTVDGVGSFPYTVRGAQTTSGGGSSDVFVAMFGGNGFLSNATYLGGSDWEMGAAIAMSGSGDVYVTGKTVSSNFPTTSQAFQRFPPGINTNVFVAQLTPTLDAVTYATYLGGSGYQEGKSIAVDAYGNAYVTGFTNSTDFPTSVYAASGMSDAFVTKFNGP